MNKLIILFILLFFVCLPVGVVLAEQIDINSATLSQLDELTGIGPKYAQAIIDARPFSSVDDLDRVKGIGPATLQKIKDQGFACVNCNASATATVSRANTQTLNPTTYSSGIFINEIMPNPSGADETNEWAELKNFNNFDVDLADWQIQDTQGTITTFTIPTGTKILANGFLVFKRPETKIMLNNDSDGLNLLTPDGKAEDSVSFATAPLGQSYNKNNSSWSWNTTATPGSANIITTTPSTRSARSGSGDLPKTQKTDNNNLAVADLSRAINANQDNSNVASPWFLFFTALAATIILASVVLFIKLKLQTNVRT